MLFILYTVEIKFTVVGVRVAAVALDNQESGSLVAEDMDMGLASEESYKLGDWEVHIDTDE